MRADGCAVAAPARCSVARVAIATVSPPPPEDHSDGDTAKEAAQVLQHHGANFGVSKYRSRGFKSEQDHDVVGCTVGRGLWPRTGDPQNACPEARRGDIKIIGNFSVDTVLIY